MTTGAAGDSRRMQTSVFGLPIARVSDWIFNCYVVDLGETLAVADPGLPVVARHVLDLVERELGRSAMDIASVLCTHAHPDHVAGVSTITARSSCTTHLPARCEQYLAGEKPRTFPLVESSLRFLPVWGGQPFSARALLEFARHGTTMGFGGPPMLRLDFEPSGFLHDGDALPGANGWQVIHAPGHTDDSTAFYHAESETLMSGDAVVTVDGHAWFNPEFVDEHLAAETEERLRSLSVRYLLPGHGEPIEADSVWTTARSFTTPPIGSGFLSRCSRRLGKWT